VRVLGTLGISFWLVGVLENGVVSRGGLFNAVSCGTDGERWGHMGSGGVKPGACVAAGDPLGSLSSCGVCFSWMVGRFRAAALRNGVVVGSGEL
jgi:hypothetical protein